MTAELRGSIPVPIVGTGSDPGRLRSRLGVLMRIEMLRFALVGGVNTALDLGIYVGLHAGGVPIIVANLISTTAGLTFSYFANRAFTFNARATGDRRRQVLLFLACTGLGLWVLQPLVILGADSLISLVGPLAPFHILLSKLAGIAVGLVWNWTLYNKVVFRVVRA